jgi:hypothetical protein
MVQINPVLDYDTLALLSSRCSNIEAAVAEAVAAFTVASVGVGGSQWRTSQSSTERQLRPDKSIQKILYW